jgi:hypothetical protein
MDLMKIQKFTIRMAISKVRLRNLVGKKAYRREEQHNQNREDEKFKCKKVMSFF